VAKPLAIISTLLAIALGYLWYTYAAKSRGSSFADWSPTPADIVRELGANLPGVYTDARHQRFIELIKHRYRFSRVPAMAVGLKFESDSRLRLLCAASIPRWHMSRLATQIFKECRTVFGRDYEIDIYETYIAMDQKKLAEARYDPLNKRVVIHFDERFGRESKKKYLFPQPLARPFGLRNRLGESTPKRIHDLTAPPAPQHGSSGAFR
jgi:hypothetical protein